MNEKGSISIPINEGQPLINTSTRQQDCARGIFCRRCIVGTHHNTSRKRIFIRRTLAVIIAVFLYYTMFGDHGRRHPRRFHGHEDHIDDIEHGDGHGHPDRGHDHGNQCRREDFIPWDGPSHFKSSASNIDFKFGKGQMGTKVAVLTDESVETPTIIIHANVTKLHHHHHDHEGDDGEMLRKQGASILNAHTKEIYLQGVHVQVKEDDGNFELHLWADEYLDHDDDHHHHHHERRKLCVEVEATIILPAKLSKFGRLSITGTVMSVDIRDISAITFDKLDISTTVGKVIFHESDEDDSEEDAKAAGNPEVQVEDLSIGVTTGAVILPSVTAPEGLPLKVKVVTIAGPIVVNAVLPRVFADEEDQKHEISIITTTGSTQLSTRPAEDDDHDSKHKRDTVPGEVHVHANSEVGHVKSSIRLAEQQILFLQSKSTTGSLHVDVDDKFLGTFKVQTQMGTVVVNEAENSVSEIQYEKNTKNIKIGHKQLKASDDDDDDGQVKGDIVLSSSFGTNELSFA
ncbi:hypothetical protein EDD11_000367 [Mortierella claussenii]|nr:hypothetical protein EDD11_000367 [Mortierella claussenii]